MFSATPAAAATSRPGPGAAGPAPEFAAIIARHADASTALREVARSLAARLDATGARVWSLTRSGVLRLQLSIGECPPCAALEDRIPADRSELGRVAAGIDPCVTDCLAEHNPAEITSWAAQHRVAVFVTVPIRHAARPCGVMGFFLHTPPSEEQLGLLTEAGHWMSPLLSSVATDEVDLSSSLIPCLSTAVITLDRDGLVTRWSGRAEQMFGWSAAEVVGRPLPIVPPERRAEFVNLPDRDVNRVYRGPAICQRADGSALPVQRVSGPLYDQRSQVVGRLEVLTDDSQRLAAARCLDVQSRVAKILADAHDRNEAVPPLLLCIGEWLNCDVAEFWAADSAGRLIRESVWASDPALRERIASAERRLPPGAAAWQAQALREGGLAYIPELSHDDAAEHAPRHRRLHIPVAGLAMPIVCGGERLGVISISGAMLCTPDALSQQTLKFVAAASAHFLARARAEADLALATASLRQSQKMDSLGLLTGGIAHDFNNVLTVILACSEMALDEVSETSSIHELVNEIHGAGQRAATMTRQLLTVSRQQPPQLRHCQLNEVVVEMNRMLERLVGPDVALRHDTEPALAAVSADVGQIQQVLLNLVVNARDAMPEGGTITISTRNVECPVTVTRSHHVPPGPYARISVGDTGCGMDEETQKRVFEPFFTTKEPGRGTGMGLATVAEIVKHHRGFVQVASRQNVGTTISLYLPPSREKLATQSVDHQPQPHAVGTETVLVVEGDESVRSLMRRLLEVRGYTVHEAADAKSAHEMLRARRPTFHLVLADLQTIGPDVTSFAAAVQHARSSPRLLIMSASTPAGDVDPALAKTVLRKPFTSADLARQVRVALDGAR